MSVGRELAEARRRRGFSLEDVAARTKIKVERLRAIEEADLLNLPAEVYLKGFLKEYASTVQLDPEDVTHRYLAELEDWAALTETNTSGDPESMVGERELDRAWNSDGEAQSFHRPILDIPPAVLGARDEDDAALAALRGRLLTVEPPDVGRLVTAVRDPQPDLFRTRRRSGRTVGRWLLPVVGVLAILIGYLVISPFFRDSAPADQVATADAGSTEASSESVDRDRTGDAVDASAARGGPASPAERARDDSARPVDTRDKTADSTPTAAPPPMTPPAEPAPPPVAPRREPEPTVPAPKERTTPVVPLPVPDPATAAPPVARREPERTVPVPKEPTTPVVPLPEPDPPPKASESAAPRASRAPNVSGSWSLATRVEASDYAAFNNLNLGYRLQLKQDGDRVTGYGQKWMENGRPVPARSRTPILIAGVIKGNRLELQFTEQGASRQSGGTFVMTLEPDGTLNGRFESDAANSRGHSLARRTAR